MNIKTNQDTSRKYNNERISDTTEGRLLFLSGLKASRLFLLPETSSFHNSDRGRHTKRWVGDYFSCIFCVPAKKLLCIPRGLPDVISMLCLSSSSLLIFSSSSLCTVSNSSSFSLCIQTHKKQTKYWGGIYHREFVCASVCFWPPSVDMLPGSHTRTCSLLTPGTALGRYLTTTKKKHAGGW